MIDWFSPSTWFSSTTSPSQRQSNTFRFSVRELERLHDLLLSEDDLLSRSSSRSLSSLSSSARRHQKYIEALRAISEIVVWADQRTEGNSDASTLEEASAIVELFLSRSMVKYFGDVLEASADDEQVVMQVLQTMTILIQNLRNEQTVYCVFSNNRVNEILLSMEPVLLVGGAGAAEGNYDVIGLYVNLLKTVVMRLDEHSVEFFLREGRVCVPYTRALRVSELDVARSDGMVRAAVQAVVLKLYSIVPASVCLGGMKTEAFLARLCDEMVGTMMELELLLRADRWRTADAVDGEEMLVDGAMAGIEVDDAFRIDSLLGRLGDDLAFFNDVLSTGRSEVGRLAVKEVWSRVVLGSMCMFQGARATSKGGGKYTQARTLAALLVLEAVCKAIESASLMGLLVSLLLDGDVVKAAGKVVEDLGCEQLTVEVLVGASGSGAPETGNVIVGLRENLLSCLSDVSIDHACRIVVLRLLAVMLDGCTPDGVLREVGLRSTDPAHAVVAVASKDAADANGAGSDMADSVSQSVSQSVFAAVLAVKRNALSPQYETQALTYAAWIVSGILGSGGAVIEAPIEPLQEFLALAHDGLLLCLPTCSFGCAAPMILNHCWSVQQRYLMTLKPRQAPSKLVTTTARAVRDGDESLRRTLACATRFVAAYQLYQIVLRGAPEVDAASPFPEDLPMPVGVTGDGHGGDRPTFRTSLGAAELGASLVIRSDAGEVLFEAPTPCVTVAPGTDGNSTKVTLTSRTAELVRGTLRTKSSVLTNVAFKSKLDRRFVERFVFEAQRVAAERSRVYLEHCI